MTKAFNLTKEHAEIMVNDLNKILHFLANNKSEFEFWEVYYYQKIAVEFMLKLKLAIANTSIFYKTNAYSYKKITLHEKYLLSIFYFQISVINHKTDNYAYSFYINLFEQIHKESINNSINYLIENHEKPKYESISV